MSKRNLSQAASNAADKFFTSTASINNVTDNDIVTHVTNNTIIDNDIDITNNTKHTHVSQPTNKSKHYDVRGKRSERYGILLDKQLKEDLQLLSNATNNRSLNDFIVTILLEYVEKPKNQEKLTAYKELLKLYSM